MLTTVSARNQKDINVKVARGGREKTVIPGSKTASEKVVWKWG